MKNKIIIITIIGVMILSGFMIMPVFGEEAVTLSYGRNTLYVGGSGQGNYTSIQDAVYAAGAGDIVFVYNGTYYENIWIFQPIVLLGENRANTIINGKGNRIIEVFSSFFEIKGFTLENTTSGSEAIFCVTGENDNIENIFISDCIFTNNDDCIIFPDDVSNISIVNCYFLKNSGCSIVGEAVKNVTIDSCIIENNGESLDNGLFKCGGICLVECSDIKIVDCDIHNNMYGGIILFGGNKNISLTNDLFNLNFVKNVELKLRTFNIFSQLLWGSDIDICSNNIYNNSFFGILLMGKFFNCKIQKNSVENNGKRIKFFPFCSGISLQGATGVTIKYNTISHNEPFGICLLESEGNEIINNNIIKNRQNRFYELNNLEKNRWDGNYWNRPRLLPKPIIGYKIITKFKLPFYLPYKVVLDCNPALKPYEIGSVDKENIEWDEIEEKIKNTRENLRSYNFSFQSGYDFDPLVSLPQREPEELFLEEFPAGISTYLVQCIGPIYEDYKDQLRNLGVNIYAYAGAYAFTVRMDNVTRQNVEKLSFIRWIGLYHPAYRIASSVIESINSEDNISVEVLYFDVEKDTIKNKLKQLNCIIETNFSDIIRVTVETKNIYDIAKLDGVIWIEKTPVPELC